MLMVCRRLMLFFRAFRLRMKSSYDIEVPEKPFGYLAAVYDAVLSYAHVVGAAKRNNHTLDEIKTDGALLWRELRNLTFESIGGTVSFDQSGDRFQDLSIYNFLSGRVEVVGRYDVHVQQWSLRSPILWPGNSTETPPITPRVCPLGEQRAFSMGIEICTACPRGTYNLRLGGSCQSCPFGAVCKGSTKVAAQQGHWIRDESLRSGGPPEVIKCLNQDCCTNKSGCFVGDASRCNEGRTGVLCANCVDNFSKWYGQCFECTSTNWGLISLCFFGSLLLIGFFALKTKLPERYPALAASPSDAPRGTLIIDFVQMAGFIKFASSDESSVSIASLLQGELQVLFGSNSFCPFFIPVIAAPLTRIFFWIFPTVQLGILQAFRVAPSTMQDVAVSVGFLMCPLVVAVSLEYWQCVQVGDNTVMLHTGLDCFSETHTIAVVVVSIVGVVFAVIFPALIVRTMLKLQRELEQKNNQSAPQTTVSKMQIQREKYLLQDLDQPISIRTFYYGIREGCQWWYQALFWLRRIFVSIIVVASPNSDQNATMTLSLSLYFGIALLFNVFVSPYQLKRDNTLQTVTLACLMCLGLLSSAWSVQPFVASSMTSAGVMGLKYVLLAFPIVLLVIQNVYFTRLNKKLAVETEKSLGFSRESKHFSGFEKNSSLEDDDDDLDDDVKAEGQDQELVDIVVHVEKAIHVPKMDLFSDSDPFVKITMGSHSKKTSHVKSTKNPIWNHELTFEKVSRSDSVKIKLIDWDFISIKQKQIGRTVSCTVGELVRHKPDHPLKIVEGGETKFGWQPHCLLYLFVRPESVPENWNKKKNPKKIAQTATPPPILSSMVSLNESNNSQQYEFDVSLNSSSESLSANIPTENIPTYIPPEPQLESGSKLARYISESRIFSPSIRAAEQPVFHQPKRDVTALEFNQIELQMSNAVGSATTPAEETFEENSVFLDSDPSVTANALRDRGAEVHSCEWACSPSLRNGLHGSANT
mmetsp:Transcript_21562/g.42780  ORF Transcript_21562/g.42780 Transcript_21562/m.42780 type:complete len:982 (+) Transcript_21562:884-3829(+)